MTKRTVKRPVIFLHIPKTAGQTVHHFLSNGVEASAVCPARENWQLVGMSVNDLRRYQIFSGHLDWLNLDCVGRNPFIFTILRDPMDRILSFYFFLRREAEAMSAEQLASPTRRGMRAILDLSPDEYFCGGPPDLRAFLDAHYDNFYTYFFAGRSYTSRTKLRAAFGKPPQYLNESGVVELAKRNLAELSAVYRLSELEQLEKDLRKVLPNPPEQSLTEIRRNTGSGDRESRLSSLSDYGPASRARARILEMCSLDQLIWEDASVFNRK